MTLQEIYWFLVFQNIKEFEVKRDRPKATFFIKVFQTAVVTWNSAPDFQRIVAQLYRECEAVSCKYIWQTGSLTFSINLIEGLIKKWKRSCQQEAKRTTNKFCILPHSRVEYSFGTLVVHPRFVLSGTLQLKYWSLQRLRESIYVYWESIYTGKASRIKHTYVCKFLRAGGLTCS